MKNMKWVALFLLISTACISPPLYNTAVTYEGMSIGAGVAYQTASRGGKWVDDDSEDQRSAYGEFTGVRPEFLISYGISPTFGVEGRFGMLISSAVRWDGADTGSVCDDSLRLPLPMAGIGLKLSTPGNKIVNFGLRMDLDFPNIVVFAPMMGISTRKGYEFATLGFETSLLVLPQALFINFHPVKGMHIYGALDFLDFNQNIRNVYTEGDLRFRSFSVGIAYNHNFGK